MGSDTVITRIQASLNGGRAAEEHPAVPVTPAQLAAAAAGAVAAGAEAVHIHPRDADGAESLAAADVGAAVEAVRASCPGIPVSVSTGLWMTGGDVAQRRAAVAEWAGLPAARRPDLASVNAGEGGFAELVAVLAGAGVLAEAGVWSPADAEVLPGVPVGRVLVEVLHTPEERAIAAADRILARLDSLGVGAPRLLHGEDDACWPLITYAGTLGLPTRIGLEDTLLTEVGLPAADNAELVRRALRRWQGERREQDQRR